MPLLDVDLSEIDSVIEPGTYKSRIAECDVKTSKQGNPMAVPKFQIDVNGKTRTRQAYLVTKGAGAYSFYNLLKATGFSEIAEQLRNGQAAQFDTDMLIGQEVNVVVEEEIYNGEKRDKIASFLPA